MNKYSAGKSLASISNDGYKDIYLFPKELRIEMYTRYKMWVTGVSTFFFFDNIDGGIKNIVMNDEACGQFCPFSRYVL